MKLLTVIGARPQFIKAAAVSRVIRSMPDVQEVLTHTGQHYDANMSDVFFRELDIPEPHHHLGIGSGPHGAMTGRMLEAIEQTLLAEKPDWVLVYGDTNSTLAGALAAAKLHIPIAHVEAGLRSWNRRMPEEINRVLTDHASSLLFAPTTAAVKNLAREGIDSAAVLEVGDVMYDVALYCRDRAAQTSRILHTLEMSKGGYILATIHRAENTDHPDRLRAILEGLAGAAKDYPVILPVHPRTRAVLQRDGLANLIAGKLRLIDPVGYLDMVMLEMSAALVVTDSGGVQKEAFFHAVPCLTLRDETEWVELVESGWNRLCPPHSAEAVTSGIRDSLGRRGQAIAPYGDGHASGKIVEALRDRAST